jgi:hypothetical protein
MLRRSGAFGGFVSDLGTDVPSTRRASVGRGHAATGGQPHAEPGPGGSSGGVGDDAAQIGEGGAQEGEVLQSGIEQETEGPMT